MFWQYSVKKLLLKLLRLLQAHLKVTKSDTITQNHLYNPTTSRSSKNLISWDGSKIFAKYGWLAKAARRPLTPDHPPRQPLSHRRIWSIIRHSSISIWLRYKNIASPKLAVYKIKYKNLTFNPNWEPKSWSGVFFSFSLGLKTPVLNLEDHTFGLPTTLT